MWVPVKWKHIADVDSFEISFKVTIEQMYSPYYLGVRYAVRYGDCCLNINGDWEDEPLPSDRDNVFYDRCRFLSFKLAVDTANKARLHLNSSTQV